MRFIYGLVALAATLAAGSVAIAKEKPDQPKERKVCRTVQISGRVTPQRVCRKVVRPSTEEQRERQSGESDETPDRRG